ncbi:hypothetical protein [Nocardiopsis sp. LOL_012]|uniref:hypothetical protein n=1 Tax=Nocardiopsis sp. LOL_012 TaxID=3345409 RepID=UPI003A84120E
MSWEGIDHALNRVRGEADRITLDLADLDRRIVHRMPKATDLAGRTRERWESVEEHVHGLRDLTSALRDVVDRATGLRATADPASRTEIGRLLDGPSVAAPLGPITSAEAVARICAHYSVVTETVSAVETAWDALGPRITELDAVWNDIGTLADMVGLDRTEYDPLGAAVFHQAEVVRFDPLALVDDGRVDTSALERLRGRLERTRGELRDALRMRDSYDENVTRLRYAVDDVAAVLSRARSLRATVVARISRPAAPDVPDPVPDLRAAVADLDRLRDAGRWRDLGTRLGELQRDIHEATDTAREREAALTGLLESRARLRGRLDAYRSRAVRAGCAEDGRLAGLHGEAHWELWSTPCDLPAATETLSSYLRRLRELVETTSSEGRTILGPAASDDESDGGGVIR